jgi:hypothetical protein
MISILAAYDYAPSYLCKFSHLSRNIFLLLIVNELLRTELFNAKLALLVSAVDCNDAHPHCFCVLNANCLCVSGSRHDVGTENLTVAQAASSTKNDDPLARSYCRSLASSICCDPTAHDRTSFFIRNAFRDPVDY